MSGNRLVMSIREALRGLRSVWTSEQNFRFQTAAVLVAVVASFLLPLTSSEQAIVILASVGVLLLELGNTIVERLLDLLKPRLHQYVRLIKEVTAGAVLLLAVTAALVWLIIFYPHFIRLWK